MLTGSKATYLLVSAEPHQLSRRGHPCPWDYRNLFWEERVSQWLVDVVPRVPVCAYSTRYPGLVAAGTRQCDVSEMRCKYLAVRVERARDGVCKPVEGDGFEYSVHGRVFIRPRQEFFADPEQHRVSPFSENSMDE